MGRITDSWSGKQKFHKGFGRKGNTKLDEYQQMLLDMEGKEWKPKNSELSFEERLKRAPNSSSRKSKRKKHKMLEFDYKLDYKKLDFTDNEVRKFYRIGRGEQGVLLVRPYTDDICQFWKFKTPEIAVKSAEQIYTMYVEYRARNDFVGMDMCRKFLEMGFTRARRYANHKDGKKYDKNGNVKPQEPDWATSDKAVSARIFKSYRNKVVNDKKYKTMRKMWREYENHNLQEIQ